MDPLQLMPMMLMVLANIADLYEADESKYLFFLEQFNVIKSKYKKLSMMVSVDYAVPKVTGCVALPDTLQMMQELITKDEQYKEIKPLFSELFLYLEAQYLQNHYWSSSAFVHEDTCANGHCECKLREVQSLNKEFHEEVMGFLFGVFVDPTKEESADADVADELRNGDGHVAMIGLDANDDDSTESRLRIKK